MFPNIMAEYEDDDMNKVFPKTDHYLFVGGPKHGQRVEVVEGDAVHKIMAPPTPTPALFGDGAGYEVHTYVKRDLGFQEDDGTVYARTVYCHDQIPNPQVAQQYLMAALLADFVRGGRKVVPDGESKLSGQ